MQTVCLSDHVTRANPGGIALPKATAGIGSFRISKVLTDQGIISVFRPAASSELDLESLTTWLNRMTALLSI